LLAKIRRQEYIKHRETHRFNVENPFNTKGKNHERQPAKTSLYRRRDYKIAH
jgi:hypothetical protein